MSDIVTKTREEIAQEDKWNVEALFPDLAAWQAALEGLCSLDQDPHWPNLAAFQGKFSTGAETLNQFFTLSFDVERELSKLYTYAHLRHDEDLASDEYKRAHSTIMMLYQDFEQELSWVEPEILTLSKETIASYLKDEKLKDYHFHLEKIVRLKPHILSPEQEELLAMAGKALGTASAAFNAFDNADLQFPNVEDAKGDRLELTHAKYSSYLRDQDRVLRKNAFQAIHQTYLQYENSICELLNGNVQAHLFHTRARKYDSSLDAALFMNQIDTKVYTNLIGTVRENLSVLHRYMGLRKKALKLDKLHIYDLYVPMVEHVDLKYVYETAEDMVIESVAPLGQEYQDLLAKGLKTQRWVDRYENLRKRSGAYSSGCYDSMPYILMNFQGTIRDVMTLAHEVGHSMHSKLSHQHQPYQYSHYPIFLAEVASTFNEELMFHLLMSKKLSDKEKAFLINQKIEDIRSTFFRQTMFAEFELFVHKQAEEKVPITPTLLKNFFRELNIDYFGPEVEVDAEIDIEWARIPHFYNNFYVYQYATGISAARSLFEQVINGGDAAREKYLKFLSSGSSHYPLDLLTRAGVNMLEKHSIEATAKQFDCLVGQLSELLPE